MARIRRPGPALSSGPGSTRLFTLGEIARKTAVPPRLLQFWTDSRLLLPAGETEHPGRGTARGFRVIELKIAALLGPLAFGGLQIGQLKAFAHIFREALTGASPQPAVGGVVFDYPEIRRVMERAARGVGVNLFVFSSEPSGRVRVAVVTDERGSPILDFEKFYGQPPRGPLDQKRFPRGEAMTTVLSLTERLSALYDP